MALSNSGINEQIVKVIDRQSGFYLHTSSLEGMQVAYRACNPTSDQILLTQTSWMTKSKSITGDEYAVIMEAGKVKPTVAEFDPDDYIDDLEDFEEDSEISLDSLKNYAKNYWVGQTIKTNNDTFFAALNSNQSGLGSKILTCHFDSNKNLCSMVVWFEKNNVLCTMHFVFGANSTTVQFKWAGTRKALLNAVDSEQGEQKILVDLFQKSFESFYIPKHERQKGATCYLIGVDGNGSLDLIELNKLVTEIDEPTLLLSYPDTNHEKIEEFLEKGVDNKGKLLLMHGKPGTGKTTYLRYLLSNKYDGEVVFMNASIFSQITSVSFVSFAACYLQNKLVVIEDAESLLVARDDGHKERTTSISDLLNFTDGLVGDALNIKVIATFNTNVEEIDQALLRKGRLFYRQMFDNLNFEQSVDLLMKLTSGSSASERNECGKDLLALGRDSYSLADIYGTMTE